MTIPSTHASLLLALKQDTGREEAWTTFQVRYRDVILAWGRRRGLSPDGAEDLTQDVLLKLFLQMRRDAYDPAHGSFRSWLKAVVNNAITDYRRWQRRRPDAGGPAFQERLDELEGPQPADELSGLLEERAKNVAAGVLDRVRARLEETTWQAFYQTMVEQRPAADVAAELGLTVGTVYKHKYRVKQMVIQEYTHACTTSCPAGDLPGRAEPAEVPA